MEELKFITLEDDKEYIIVDEIESNDITYVYLTNSEDEKDFCIRKVNRNINSDILNGLDSDNEFDKAILLFTKKHKDDDLTEITE